MFLPPVQNLLMCFITNITLGWWFANESINFLQQEVINTSLSNLGRLEKVKISFYFHTSLCCRNRFYEGLKGLHKTFWGSTKKCENKNLNYFLFKYNFYKCTGRKVLKPTSTFCTDVTVVNPSKLSRIYLNRFEISSKYYSSGKFTFKYLIPILFGNNNNHLVGNTLSTVILRVLEIINFSNWKYERIKIDVVT